MGEKKEKRITNDKVGAKSEKELKKHVTAHPKGGKRPGSK